MITTHTTTADTVYGIGTGSGPKGVVYDIVYSYQHSLPLSISLENPVGNTLVVVVASVVMVPVISLTT